MSVLYKGQLLDTDLTKNARGGTEQMRDRLLQYADNILLKEVAIHFSRPKELYDDVPNILYCHDLAEDPAVVSLEQDHGGFDHFVFVSYWQRDQFINRFGLPYSKCTVIHNAIETEFDSEIKKSQDQIRFIYHTTPHRGLELVYPIFDRLCQIHDNIHLDVYSSFGVYGWEQRDEPYSELFAKIQDHPHMTYHGAKSNAEVLAALRNAHIFLYPSIWKETSCIALIEAMNSGCLCIYPSYGALPETGMSMNNMGMYAHSENIQDNAIRALNIAHAVLANQKQDSDFLRKLVLQNMNVDTRHTIPAFQQSWNFLLAELIKDVDKSESSV